MLAPVIFLLLDDHSWAAWNMTLALGPMCNTTLLLLCCCATDLIVNIYMALTLYTAGWLQEVVSSHSLGKTGLWLALSWGKLQLIDCKEKMHDSNAVPPIHSLSLVHSLTRKLQFRRIHLQPAQTCQVTRAEQRFAHPSGPLCLSPPDDISGFAARRGGFSLCWPPRHMQLATVISSFLATTLCVGPVLSQAFPARFLCLAKPDCNTFKSSSYCSVIDVPINRRNLCEVVSKRSPDSIYTNFCLSLNGEDRQAWEECNVTQCVYWTQYNAIPILKDHGKSSVHFLLIHWGEFCLRRKLFPLKAMSFSVNVIHLLMQF